MIYLEREREKMSNSWNKNKNGNLARHKISAEKSSKCKICLKRNKTHAMTHRIPKTNISIESIQYYVSSKFSFNHFHKKKKKLYGAYDSWQNDPG